MNYVDLRNTAVGEQFVTLGGAIVEVVEVLQHVNFQFPIRVRNLRTGFEYSVTLEGDVYLSDTDSCDIVSKVTSVQPKPLPVTQGGTKHDQSKTRLDLLPFSALQAVGDVLAHGAVKYDAWNWKKGFNYSRLIGASLRHIFAFARGENNDPESGLPHLAHAACCVLFLLEHTLESLGSDDRHSTLKGA